MISFHLDLTPPAWTSLYGICIFSMSRVSRPITAQIAAVPTIRPPHMDKWKKTDGCSEILKTTEKKYLWKSDFITFFLICWIPLLTPVLVLINWLHLNVTWCLSVHVWLKSPNFLNYYIELEHCSSDTLHFHVCFHQL